MSAEQFQIEKREEHLRNPLAVFNVDYTYGGRDCTERIFLSDIPHVLRERRKKFEQIRGELKKIRPETGEEHLRHPVYEKRRDEWQKLKRGSVEVGTTQDTSGRFVVFDCFVHDFPEMLRIRDELEQAWTTLYTTLQQLDSALRKTDDAATPPAAPQPQRREDLSKGTCVIDLPTLSDVRQYLEQVRTLIPSGKKAKKKKLRVTAAQSTKAPVAEDSSTLYAEAAALTESIQALKEYLALLCERLNMAEAYIRFDEDIRQKYREKAMLDHPDRNPGDEEAAARFKESTGAYGKLADITDEARRALGFDLVFGDTSAWTAETRRTLARCAALFAGIFAKESPPPVGNPCVDCGGKGAMLTQTVNDFIPVAKRCGTCEGNGTIPTVAKKKKI